MDSLITAAARALAAGDPFTALNRVALRDDAPALALRGIAMAQLGDLARARALLRRARHAFGPREELARARCHLAEAEVALANRDLLSAPEALEAARRTLAWHGDRINAVHAGLLIAHHQILVGRLDDAEERLEHLDTTALPPALHAVYELARAGIAVRRLRPEQAGSALARAGAAARHAGISALVGEVETTERLLQQPAARLINHRGERPVRLEEVAALLGSPTLVVDGCRYRVSDGERIISLTGRPVLFTLAALLARAWPDDADRNSLIEGAFRLKHPDDSHRARLRVELGRLRRALKPVASIEATARGFLLKPRHVDKVALLARPVDGPHGAVLALLADGQAWASSALALALGTSQRGVQRALDQLARAGKVAPLGHGRTRRWVAAPAPGFTTTLLLTLPPPGS
ncbi:MAG: helix-turn-helix domain-containing protein [Alcanivorax sp.]|nr:helix-turn-helix domain-containing protein [Alcanivorax sp.]UWN51314.1 hypothetical protein ASALC70_03541 [Alcanivorax sp. ALC70]